MKQIDKMAEAFAKEQLAKIYPEGAKTGTEAMMREAHAAAYRAVYCAGFRAAKELLSQEIRDIAAQTEDSAMFTLALHFENFGETETKKND